jgi:ribonuclease D
VRSPGAIGIDTEFLRERTYYAQLCLLQIATSDDCFCVDTLALGDLTALRPAMNDAAVLKIVHAARQDLEVLWPVTGPVRGIFDTQVAAALCGFAAQVGYGELVARVLDRELHKAHTRTDWSRRPLSEAQLEYALDDVRYLLPLRDQLAERLQSLGRMQWFDEEMQQLDATENYDNDPQHAWLRFKGFADFDEHRQRLAQSLAAWRESRAMQSNRPRGWILPDAALRDIVARAPRDAAALARIAELPEGIRTNSGAQLLQIVSEARLPADLPPLPQRQRPDPEQLARADRLIQRLRSRAQELELAPEVLATRREVEQLAGGDRDGALLQGWRRNEIGERLLALL